MKKYKLNVIAVKSFPTIKGHPAMSETAPPEEGCTANTCNQNCTPP